jgi:hypothetical protein
MPVEISCVHILVPADIMNGFAFENKKFWEELIAYFPFIRH